MTDRADLLSQMFKDELKSHKAELSGRPFDTNTLAEVFALCLSAYEKNRGELPKPSAPKKKSGFDPLWSQNAYELVEDRGVEGIRCTTCNHTSYHPEDIRHRYCGYCRSYHETP